MVKKYNAIYVLYLALGTTIFFLLLWMFSQWKFRRNMYNVKSYVNTNLPLSIGTKGVYTWIIHMYPPIHNAGAEMMAHHMNTFLIRESNKKVNVILNNINDNMYERVNIISRKDIVKREAAILDSQLLLSHLDNEHFAVKTGVVAKKPVVLVMHNSFRKKYLKVFKDMLPNNLYLIHNSIWIKDYYSEFNIPSIVVYPPVDWRDYAVETTREYVSLINMNKNKGGEIFYELVKRMPDVKFLGVKGAYDKQIVNEYPNLVLVNNTPQIKEIYSRTNILLMPSKYESWGRTAVEAMSSGIPVIAHPTPGLLESCGDAGIFCDRDNIDMWEKEIRRLIKDEEYYKKKSDACKKRAVELDPEPQLAKMSKWLEGIQWTNTK